MHHPRRWELTEGSVKQPPQHGVLPLPPLHLPPPGYAAERHPHPRPPVPSPPSAPAAAALTSKQAKPAVAAPSTTQLAMSDAAASTIQQSAPAPAAHATTQTASADVIDHSTDTDTDDTVIDASKGVTQTPNKESNACDSDSAIVEEVAAEVHVDWH